jgi:hypothetical protein
VGRLGKDTTFSRAAEAPITLSIPSRFQPLLNPFSTVSIPLGPSDKIVRSGAHLEKALAVALCIGISLTAFASDNGYKVTSSGHKSGELRSSYNSNHSNVSRRTYDANILSTESISVSLNNSRKSSVCDDVGHALDAGKVGDIVANHEKLILHYYEDVQDQAKQRFASAKSVAHIGFWVLIATLAYLLLIDALTRVTVAGLVMTQPSKVIVSAGLVSGALIEFIAGVNFWLYARASK